MAPAISLSKKSNLIAQSRLILEMDLSGDLHKQKMLAIQFN